MAEKEASTRKRSGGMYCLFKNCKNQNISGNKEVKFFYVPKDEVRCRQWLQAAGRMDLLHPEFNAEKASKKYRVCSDHFDNSMYHNYWERTRLLSTAYPEPLYEVEKVSIENMQPGTSHQSEEHQEKPVETDSENSSGKIKILQNVCIVSPDDSRMLPSPPLLSPVETQTETCLSASSPRKEKLRWQLEGLKKQNVELKKELDVALNILHNPTEEFFKSCCDRFLSPTLSNFVKCQVDLLGRSAHGRRYTTEYKQFALALYFLSPKCFRQLEKTFCLPTYRSLCRFVEKIQFSAGINESLFKLLEIKVAKFQPLDKVCVLCMDEMSIKSNLFYNYGTDTIVGLEDNGNKRSNKPASSATVFMARGIKSSWKQPLAYCFSATTYDAREVIEILHKIVECLSNIGLDVVCLISDMGSNCLELSKILGVSDHNQKISLGGKDLFYYFDPPHMIKSMRNNLLKCDFKWDNYTASWSDIVGFYERDSTQHSRLAPKLTKSHIEPTNFERMRVKLATQVISRTVAAAIDTYVNLGALPSAAAGTAILLDKFDKLFDMFNSSNLSSTKIYNRPFTGEDFQVDFLNDMLQFLNELVLYNSKTKKKVSVKFLNCWKITIQSLLQLWHVLECKGFQFILTRRLTQDCVENYFGSIRQQHGNAVNPTPIQFTRAYKKSFVSDFIHTEDMNCIEDLDTVITHINDFSVGNIVPITVSTPTSSFQVESCNYHQLSLPEQNAFKYVCGYLIDKCLKIHTCTECRKFSTENEVLQDSNIFIHFKAFDTSESNFGSLKTPHESFYNYIYQLEKLFLENINSCILKNPGNSLYSILQRVTFKHPCPNFPVTYLLKLYIRFRIYYLLKYSNSAFKSTPTKNRRIIISMNL